MPLTPNGKIDRKALPAPDMTRSDEGYVAPRTATEIAMAEIWADILKRDKVGIHDDFFALGGHSLLAVQLVSRLRHDCAITMAVRDLFVHPTLGALAAQIDNGKGENRHPNLVPIRAAGNRKPLFLIHPIGGEVQYAYDLVRHLDAELPVYGLAASGLSSGEVPQSSIKAMASTYLQAIREVQPTGPYSIAGWSLGGMISYEIAHQLSAAGQVVDFVGMIDTGNSQLLRVQLQIDQIGELDESRALLNWIVDQHPDIEASRHAAYGELIALAYGKNINAMVALCKREKIISDHIEMDAVKRILALYRAAARAAVNYQAPIMASATTTVSLFAADRPAEEDETLGWGSLLGERLQVMKIGGTHMTIVRPPHIAKLGAAISRTLSYCTSFGNGNDK
jgi:thioesterase domain-containing protein